MCVCVCVCVCARVVRTFLIYERAYFLGLLHMDIRSVMPVPRGCEDGNGRSACNFNGGPSASLVDSFLLEGRLFENSRGNIPAAYIYAA